VIVNSEYRSDTPVAQGNPGDVWTFVLDRGRTFSGSIDGTVDYVSTMYGACDNRLHGAYRNGRVKERGDDAPARGR